MDIPFTASVAEFLDREHLKDDEYPNSSYLSLKRVIENNPNKFTCKETEFLLDLLNNDDYSNRLIAYEIIKSK